MKIFAIICLLVSGVMSLDALSAEITLDLQDHPVCQSNYQGFVVSYDRVIKTNKDGRYIVRLKIANMGEHERYLCVDLEDSTRFKAVKTTGFAMTYGGEVITFPRNKYLYKRVDGFHGTWDSALGVVNSLIVHLEIPEEVISDACTPEILCMLDLSGFDVGTGCEFTCSHEFVVKLDSAKDPQSSP